MSKKLLRIALLILILPLAAQSQDLKKFTHEDVLKFRDLQDASISWDGFWVAYSTVPDRGNPHAFVRSSLDTTTYKIERGINPKIARSGEWVAAQVKPDAVELANDSKLKNGMAILSTESGDIFSIDDVKSFEFSNDSRWLIYRPDEEEQKIEGDKYKEKNIGSTLVIRHLNSGTEIPVKNVTEYHIDTLSNYIFYAKSDKSGKSDGIYYRDLQEEYIPEYQIYHEENYHFSNIAWNKRRQILAYLSASINDEGHPYKCSLWFWDPETKMVKSALTPESVPEDWYIPHKNELKWTLDGERLFMGIKPDWERWDDEKEELKFTAENFFNLDSILRDRDLDVWHAEDPRIKPNEKKMWPQKKDRAYQSVYHLDSAKFVQLADTSMPMANFVENSDYTVGYNDKPYLKLITWDGWYHDIYLVDLWTGDRKMVAGKLSERAHISPFGKFVAYFDSPEWMLYDIEKDSTINLTSRIGDTRFENREPEIPQIPNSYGLAGWVVGDSGVYIYDKWDVWLFSTTEGYGYNNITVADGYHKNQTFRIVKMDPDKRYYQKRDSIYMVGFYNESKNRGFYLHETNIMGTIKLFEQDNLFTFLEKSRNSNKILFTTEKYDRFPDLRLSNFSFTDTTVITNLNSRIEKFNWGDAQLVGWKNTRGDTLQGFIIKPEDYDPGKKYPVLIYFYEKFSDRYHRFTVPRINHRPTYPVYASDGYIVFLPDIKYTTGNPGFDATDALTTGARMLIDSGYADPDRIGIQGHSWGGYETAFIVTQTNMFAAACAGAPVSNMTSAYSGIRLGTGLARQFQYEKYQSRIGGNLWDSLDNYLKNSPVFEAPKVETPLLIMFGDVDEAVPWQQGIELYLALRRLDKNIVFLQYRDEPHHPRKIENQLDYAIKMKEFYDHYLKGAPAPDWLKKGVPYKGK